MATSPHRRLGPGDWRALAAACAVVVAIGLTLATVPSSAAEVTDPSTTFVETFDGEPASPTPWESDRWDIAVHSRDLHTWHELEPMTAHHGPDCSGPSQTHEVSAYEDAVFQCRDHVMTSINASGYGAIYLTPDHMVDFSRGTAVVRFDISTLRSSTRDWWDLWLTPYEDNLQAPLEGWFPDLAGPPRNALQITLNDANTFIPRIYRDHEEQVVASQSWTRYDSFLTPSASRRDTVELHISRTHVKFGMPQYDYWPIDADVADLGWDQAVLQLGHHSYNPTKGGTGPGTWHWDNLEIAPAVPFTIIGTDRRHVGPGSPATVVLDRPAPAGAHLRFSGMGTAFEISVDGGSTWEAAQQPSQITSNGPLFANYWTPVPEGTQRIELRGSHGWLPSWIAKDFAVWSADVAHADPDAEPVARSADRPSPDRPSPSTPIAEPSRGASSDCPPAWQTAGSCQVPAALRDHLRDQLGADAARSATDAMEEWFASG